MAKYILTILSFLIFFSNYIKMPGGHYGYFVLVSPHAIPGIRSENQFMNIAK
jgi:hypothetical protein